MRTSAFALGGEEQSMPRAVRPLHAVLYYVCMSAPVTCILGLPRLGCRSMASECFVPTPGELFRHPPDVLRAAISACYIACIAIYRRFAAQGPFSLAHSHALDRGIAISIASGCCECERDGIASKQSVDWNTENTKPYGACCVVMEQRSHHCRKKPLHSDSVPWIAATNRRNGNAHGI